MIYAGITDSRISSILRLAVSKICGLDEKNSHLISGVILCLICGMPILPVKAFSGVLQFKPYKLLHILLHQHILSCVLCAGVYSN